MKLRRTLRNFACHVLDWHVPTYPIRPDARTYGSRCRHCNDRILLDGRGSWFSLDRYANKVGR